MKAAIDAVPYASAVKFGLQFSRRFWEEDEHIFGGISYTDLPIRQISYPSTNFNAGGKGVLLGGYTWDGPNSYEFTAMPPAESIRRAVEFGAQIHPQYRDRVRDWRFGRLAPRPVHARVRGRMVGRGAIRPLRRPLPDRWPDRARRRTRLLHSRLAGGRDPVGAGRDPAPAQARRRIVRLLAPLALALIAAAALGWAALADDAVVKSVPMSRGWVFRRTGRSGPFRQCLRRLPPAGRQRRCRRRRLSAARRG